MLDKDFLSDLDVMASEVYTVSIIFEIAMAVRL